MWEGLLHRRGLRSQSSRLSLVATQRQREKAAAEAATKKEGKDFERGVGCMLMLEKMPDGTSRTPKVKLTEGWLVLCLPSTGIDRVDSGRPR